MPDPEMRVLIVEDEDEQVKAMAEWLRRRKGIIVDMTKTGEHALEMVQDAQGGYDAALIDERLPGMSGTETMRRIKAEYPAVVPIMFSEHREAGVEALRAGAYRYVFKPLDNNEIALYLDQVREIRASQRRTDASGRLIEVTRRIAEHVASVSKGALLQEIAAAGRDLLDGAVCLVWELDKSGRWFRVTAWAGEVDEAYRQKVRLDSRAEATRRYLEKRQPLALTDLQEARGYLHKREARKRGWISLLSMPIIVQERAIGILDVYTRARRTFEPWEKDLLAAFAAQAAVALQQASLAEHIQAVSKLALSGDYEKLKERVVEAVHDLTGMAVVLWMMSDREGEKGTTLRIAAMRGIRHDAETYQREAKTPLELGKSITSIAWAERRIVQRRDIQQDDEEPAFHNLPKAIKEGWHAFMCVPLLGETGEPVGTLSIYGPQPREFGEPEQALLSTFANQAAIAFESVQKQRGMLQLSKFGTLVNRRTPAGLKAVLERAARSARDLIGADGAAIYPYDPERQHFYDLENIGICGPGEKRPRKGKPRKRGLAAIVREVDELVVHDVEKGEIGEVDFRRIKEVPPVTRERLLEFIDNERFLSDEKIKAFVGLSLKAGASGRGRGPEEVGVLYINFCQPHHFGERELALIRLFGQQTASAIHSARMLERERALRRISTIIGAETDPRKAAEKILDELARVIDYHKASVQLIKGDYREIIARRGFDESAIDEWLLRPVSKDALIKRIVESKKPIVLSDLRPEAPTRDPDWEVRPETSDIMSWVGFPLVYGGEVIGLLTLDHNEPESYTEGVGRLLEPFCHQAAAAIQHADLYRRERERVKAIETLQKVGAQISATLDVQGAIRSIVEAAIELIGAESGVIHLIDRSGQRITDSYESPEGEGRIKTRFEQKEGLTWEVFRTRKPVRVADVPHDPRSSPGLARSGIKSCIGVPLTLDKHVIGVLFLNRRRTQPFTDEEVDRLARLADQAASTVGNALVFQRTLEAVQRINEAVVSKKRDEILQLIAEQAVEMLPGEHSELWLIESATGDLVLEKAHGAGEQEARKKGRIRAGTGSINAWVAQNGQPYICKDARHQAEDDPRFLRVYRRGRSSITVPLKYRGRVIGTLNVESARPNAFTEQHCGLLDTFGDAAAIAIENARLYEQRQQAYAQLEQANTQLEQANEQLASTIKQREKDIAALCTINQAVTFKARDEILQMVAQKAIEVLPGVYSDLWLIEPGTGDLVLGAVHGADPGAVKKIGRIKAGTPSINLWVAKTGRSYICKDAERSERGRTRGPRFLRIYQDARSSVTVPLRYQKRVIGTLNVESSSPHAFTTHHRDLLRSFADAAVIAIENARRIADLEAVNKVGETLTSSIRLSERQILDLIYRQATQLGMDTSDMYIALYDQEEDMVRFGLAMDNGRRVNTARETGWGPRKAGRGLTEHVIRTKKAYRPADVEKAYATIAQDYIGKKPKSWLGVPMMVGNEVLGVVVLRNDERENVYSAADQKVLQAIATQSAIALQNARLLHELERRRKELDTVLALAEDLGRRIVPDAV